jgi:hypothetical protein
MFWLSGLIAVSPSAPDFSPIRIQEHYSCLWGGVDLLLRQSGNPIQPFNFESADCAMCSINKRETLCSNLVRDWLLTLGECSRRAGITR